MKKLLKHWMTVLAGLLAVAGVARADAVVDWNDITLTAATTGRPGVISVLDVALVQVAVHDSVQALEGRFEPYHVEVPGAHGARTAAVAAAAHDVLVGMYPAQAATLDAIYFSYLADRGLTNDPGIAVGQRVAAGILPLRRADPNPLPPPFLGGTAPGVWRPTDSFLSPQIPPPFAPMGTTWVATMDPFTLTGPARFRAGPPPVLNSPQYTRDFDEVKAYGGLESTARSPLQTDIALFYSENFIGQWNRALRGIATRYSHRIGDSARLFALANLAMADAFITTWDGKRFYVFWRPLTAVRLGDFDGNPQTAGEPAWQPLINTPNYPDYPSGANCVTAAVTRTLALFFGRDRVTFDVTTLAPRAMQKTRTYQRFSDAARDVENARVWLGIHFRTADVVGRAQGRRVADWGFRHYLLPLEGDEHHGRGEFDERE